MPELPEVESIVRCLQAEVVGRQVERFHLYWPRTLAVPAPDAMEREIAGRRIAALRRRAKFLVFDLDGSLTLLVHLRMTGGLSLHAPDEPLAPHVRAAFDLSDGRQMRFEDMRKFGRIWLTADAATVLGRLGPEPLDAAFTAEAFAARLQGRRTRLKPLLLDQTFVAGLGNIYADEAIYLAGLHPKRLAHTLRSDEAARLHGAIRTVLTEAIAHRGTTLDSYRLPNGESGGHQNYLQVFRQAGGACPRCGTPVVREVIGGRSSFYCPCCQPAQ
ncbi:MAG: bifunctional DNA-formamidopyrimidine glycosylase/DNA-(apurinic or apyrimidinic site) lyase [Chloroflexi bacterium]|nr:bifunctional DNA-formamidopyrimidine glycosylase/DNA-(apurinic or apyrimidinic site) lyase [Chloroflexota bacterium]